LRPSFAFGERLFTLSGELLKKLRFDRGQLRETGRLQLSAPTGD
jgi:hypothetical protein